MQCPACHKQNPDSAKFCAKCGARLLLTCPKCGAELPLAADTHFCVECGAELGAQPSGAAVRTPETVVGRLQRLIPKQYAERLLATRGQVHDERRTVTILFSDVKGSTAIAEKLDPEDVKEIMDGAFEFLIAPIYRYEGTLARLMGDAVLAFFGAPLAHEDDPERACRAALEITAEAAEYAEKLEKERGIKGFNVRVGINTGLVVVGEVGSDLRVEYTAMGDAINLAARMEQAAEPGTVLVAEETHKLIAPLFETRALGPVQVKGKAEPVPAYRVMSAKSVAGKVRGIAGLESPLVGRQAEFAALQEAIERLKAGVGGIVTIVGEAGIGKSRLVAEMRKLPDVIARPYSAEAISPSQERDCFGEKMPRNDGHVSWVEGRCLSYGTSIAYLLWLDVLRNWLAVTVEDSPEQVRERLRERVLALCGASFERIFPYLARLMSLPLDSETESKLRDLDGQQLKTGTFDAMEALFFHAAAQRPLVLVCEDLHWADPTSLELLERLLALTDRAALLCICVFRPAKEHGSWRIRETAARLYPHRHTDLCLESLSPAESTTLMSNLLRGADLPPELKQRILSKAEGNPFYVEEIIRSLIDSRAITRDEATGRWTATQAVADIAIPGTLQGVLMARIDRLQEETKRVLQMAAVIGRIFLYRVLTAIAQEERELDRHLMTLQWQEMIRERARIPELEYIFKHQLTQEAAYNGLLKKDRRVFHRQVAEALERLFPERIEEQLGLLAHHWECAEEPDAKRATHYLLRAGDQARLAYAHQEAVDFYQRALTLLKKQGDYEQVARTLMKLGLTYHTGFDFPRSRQAYDEGFALWQRAGQTEPADLPPAPHALRLPWVVDTLDPAICETSYNAGVIDQLFSGLVKLTPEIDVVPDMTQTWEVLEGGRQYVFHLRDDARWSDGTPVTADDFGYAWKRVLDPATNSPTASLLYDVRNATAFHQRQVSDPALVGVYAADALTLVVELEGPTGYFLHLLGQPVAYPVPRHVVQAHGAAWAEVGNIVTNGPFRVEAWNRTESMTLVRNPKYRRQARGMGNVQRVELYAIADPSAALEMYETDRLDMVTLWNLPVPEIARAQQRHAGEYLSAPRLSTLYLAFNVRRPPFDDVRVRRAFVMSTDRETLVDISMRGYASATTGGFVPLGMPGHSPGIALPYDPDQARRLLVEAGYPPGGSQGFPIVEALIAPFDEPYFEYLRTHWRENLGVEITWEVLDYPMFWDKLKREPPHAWTDAWGADYPDPDNFLRVSPARWLTGWRNEAYDRLVEEARRITDQGARMKLYRQADRILVEEAAITPYAYLRSSLLVKPWVRNYLQGWRNVIIEPH